MNGTPAHARVHLDQLRPCRGVLALHVEDALVEAQRREAADREILELALLLQGQKGRAAPPSLVEVGLNRGSIVRDRRIAPLALGHHHVDIHLRPVEVLFQQDGHVDDALRLDALGRSSALDQRSAHDDQGAELRHDLAVAPDEVLDRPNLLDAQGRRSRDGLQHGREAHVLRGLEQIPLRVYHGVAGRRQARSLQGNPCCVLAPRRVDRGWWWARQSEPLGQTSDQRDGELHERADAIRVANGSVLAEIADAVDGVLKYLAGRPAHVQGDKLGSDALGHQLAAPGVRMVDDD
mmetsp:Transcript_68740/g.214836  ORF Transcript_68740/g.214836 Transcript_68740/m.214836 type:complete len:293 (-) Transcript_68740:547-1425(-)